MFDYTEWLEVIDVRNQLSIKSDILEGSEFFSFNCDFNVDMNTVYKWKTVIMCADMNTKHHSTTKRQQFHSKERIKLLLIIEPVACCLFGDSCTPNNWHKMNP